VAKELTLLMVGDIILDDDDAEPLFNASRPLLASGDVVVGHVEVPHTVRGQQSAVEVPGSGGDPQRLEALGRANFHIATLAANHLFDFGAAGVADTLDALHKQDIKTAGAGMNIAEARRPALLVRDGVRFGVLSYNCVGPRESWATEGKPGAAYVHCMTHYDSGYGTSGPARNVYTFADPKTLELMQKDIEKLRKEADIVVVALHKGVVHTPAKIVDSERQVAKAAIDAGADIVVGHHSHILRGIEIYKGKPIFHGLCNFVCVTHALSVSAAENTSPERLAWAEKRRELFGFLPDPNYPKYPFHPEAKHTIVAVAKVGKDGVHRAGFVPCWVKPSGEVEPLGPGERGNAGLAYMEQITRKAGFATKFRWDGDYVAIE
jgi:poly-gamma-glutamate synthesis protein (capsule biosynthesis protein)